MASDALSIPHTDSCPASTSITLTHFRDLHKPRMKICRTLRELILHYQKEDDMKAMLNLIHLCNFACPAITSTSLGYVDGNEVDNEKSDYLCKHAQSLLNYIGQPEDLTLVTKEPHKKVCSICRQLELWVVPSSCCLNVIKDFVLHRGLTKVASIGCGTGLFEWLLNSTKDIEVLGYEIDSKWWYSKYAPRTFIDLIYVDPKQAPPCIPETQALLFCYFNDQQVFSEYVKAYKGEVVIIIGSLGGSRGVHTEPSPLDLEDVWPWQLVTSHQVSSVNMICFYEKIKNDES